MLTENAILALKKEGGPNLGFINGVFKHQATWEILIDFDHIYFNDAHLK